MAILGVDVFSGYGPIDWHAAHAAGVRFAIPKCSEGNEPRRNDTRFRANVDGARAAGIVTTGYHYLYGLDPKKGPADRAGRIQADYYWYASGGLGARVGELPPVVDLEWPTRFGRADKNDPSSPIIELWKQWKTDENIIVDNALECLARLEELSGRVPILYTFPDFMVQIAHAKNIGELARYPLWIASYAKRHHAVWLPGDDEKPASIPKPWDDFKIWQFSADGSPMRIPGINCAPIDRDFMRSAEDLAALAGMDAPPSSWEEVTSNDFEIVHPEILD